MTERPEAAALLDEARRSLLEVLLPLLPADRRYDGLMIANAMAIASREARRGDDPLRRSVQALAVLLDASDAYGGGTVAELHVALRDLEGRLGRDIRRGAYDASGPRRDAVRAYLRASTEDRVRVSNPKALGGS